MTNGSIDNVHSQVELLLPWYVNGTLSKADSSIVNAHLNDCVQCQQELTLCKSMQSAIVDQSPSPLVPQPDSNALFQFIDQHQRRKESTWPKVSYFAAAATLAAVAIIVLVTIKSYVPVGNQQFQTATSAGGELSMDVVIDLEFAEQSTQPARMQLIQEINTETNISQPIQDIVRLTVKFPVSSLEELEAHRIQLERKSLVRSVDLVALQVPVRHNQ